MTEKTVNSDVVKEPESKYTKEQILASKRYQDRRDLIHVLVLEGESCTLAEVNKRIEEFRKGKVK